MTIENNAPSFDAPDAEWLVWADALQQRGDPRGELAALVHGANARKLGEFVRRHAEALLGDAARHFRDGQLELTWRWGFVDRATLRGASAEDLGEAWAALTAAPVGARVRALTLVGVPDEADLAVAGAMENDRIIDLSPLVARIASGSALEELHLVDDRAEQCSTLTSRNFDPRVALVQFGPLERLWRMKGLRRLRVVVADPHALRPGTIDAPELESLTIHGLRYGRPFYGHVRATDLSTALARAKLPRLREFDCRLCEEYMVNVLNDRGAYRPHEMPTDPYESGVEEGTNQGVDWPVELGDALRTLVASPLERLALTSFESAASLLSLLAQTGLPRSLKVLDLSDSSLWHDDLPWFVTRAPELARLDRLVLNETGFTDDDVQQLEALGVKVEHSFRPRPPVMNYDTGMEEPAPPGRPLPRYRYVVGME